MTRGRPPQSSAPGRSAGPTKVVGRYALFDRIATGGMATVHLGRLVGAAGFARTVAIKRLRTNYARDPKFVKMFIDEARMSSRVRHPNVAATVDVVSDGDELLLVMEYVHGESLSRLIASTKGQGVDARVAVALGIGALHGLHAAHEAKSEHGEPLEIIHRDVSPQNILLGEEGVPRVVDFGIAKAANRMQRTDSNHVKGKPRYMAPEQLQGENNPIDHRVDIFSMGTVMWETLTGRALFNHSTFVGVLAQVLRMPITPPHEIVQHLDERLSQVVMRALSRDPNERYATALDFALALEGTGAGVATQHALSSFVRDRASAVLAERQAMIEAMERVELALGDRPSTIDDSRVGHDTDETPAPDDMDEDRLARESLSNVLAGLKTLKLAPKSERRPAEAEEPIEESPPDGRVTIEDARTTVEGRRAAARTTDLLPTEPSLRRPHDSDRPASIEERPPMPRLEAPAVADALAHPAASDPPPALAPAPRRIPGWALAVGMAVLLAVAATLVVLILGELETP